MGKSILFVTILEDNIQYLEINEKSGGLFPNTPETAASTESLQTAANRASEIYLAIDSPDIINEWQTFPKVKDSHIRTLTERDLNEKFGTQASVEIRHTIIKEVVDEGSNKNLVNYVAYSKERIDTIRAYFGASAKKIKQITPLSMSLAALVCETHKPTDDYFMVWVGERSTVIAIVTSKGLVKLSRSIPVSLAKKQSEQPAAEKFASVINRELSMTATFCRQKLRISPPDNVYLFGNDKLEEIITTHPLENTALNLTFGLAQIQSGGLTSTFANDYAYLLCNKCSLAQFNFIPREEGLAKKLVLFNKISLTSMAAGLVLAGLWTGQIVESKTSKLQQYEQSSNTVNQLRQEIEAHKDTIENYRPIIARKELYEKRFINQPPWEELLNELSELVPPEILITDYDISHQGNNWRNALSGQVKAKDWESGLTALREFGQTINAATRFDINNTDYNFGELSSDPKIYHFTMDLTLYPGKGI